MHDKNTKDRDFKVGDLVMFKVQPKYKHFQGPFVIVSLTATNAVIKVQGDKAGKSMNVSRQRLSKRNQQLGNARPWLGQSGKVNY